MNNPQRRELIELWLMAGEAVADEAQLARLSQWLESDREARSAVLNVSRQQGWLAWNAANVRLPAALKALARAVDEAAPNAAAASRLVPGRPVTPPRLDVSSAERRETRSKTSWTWLAVAASLVGFFAGRWFTEDRRIADLDDGRGPLVQATMVSSTGCVWGPGNTVGGSAGRGLAGGDSLQLLEGIAEFRIGLHGSDVRLQMEGPASVVLTAQGAASMSYGKIIIKTGDVRQPYPIETSFGRVLVDSHSEIGLVSFGSTAEVHSFSGGATLESPWLVSSGESMASEEIEAGDALHFNDVGGGALKAARGSAQRGRFTLQMPMTHDFLAVDAEYVRAITDSRPVAYWRFEGDQDGLVRNEVADRFHGRLKGMVRWVGPVGNRAIEFGVTPEPCSVVCNDSWDEVLDGDFALEAWIKPSHYHLGSIIGFIGEFDWEDRRNKHGVLLEVNGTSQPSNIHQPQRIRFLHRATLGVEGGVSCYSDRAYEPRQWQHVAAVREGDQLKLYLNGELVQQVSDPEPTPLGLQLVMGQLYTETVERFFIGHVDEVAIYDRPLTDKEVRRRYELLRPPVRSGNDVL